MNDSPRVRLYWKEWVRAISPPSISRTQPRDIHLMSSSIPGQHDLSQRDKLSFNPIDQ